MAGPHDLAVAKVNLEELRAGEQFVVLVLEQAHALFGAGVVDVGRVGPGVMTVEAEANPAMAFPDQVNLAFGPRGHLGRVEDEQLLALLIADPELGFIGRQRHPVGPMSYGRSSRGDPVQKLAGLQIHDIEPDGLPQPRPGG